MIKYIKQYIRDMFIIDIYTPTIEMYDTETLFSIGEFYYNKFLYDDSRFTGYGVYGKSCLEFYHDHRGSANYNVVLDKIRECYPSIDVRFREVNATLS